MITYHHNYHHNVDFKLKNLRWYSYWIQSNASNVAVMMEEYMSQSMDQITLKTGSSIIWRKRSIRYLVIQNRRFILSQALNLSSVSSYFFGSLIIFPNFPVFLVIQTIFSSSISSMDLKSTLLHVWCIECIFTSDLRFNLRVMNAWLKAIIAVQLPMLF